MGVGEIQLSGVAATNAPECLALTERHGLRSISQNWIEVKAIEIHHLVPGRHEVIDKLLLRVVTGIDFRDGSKLRVRAEHEIDGSALPFDLTRLAVTSFEEVLADGGLLPHGAHVQQVHEEVVGQRLGSLREDAKFQVVSVGIQDSHAADQHGHLRSREREQVCSIDQQLFRRSVERAVTEVVAEPVRGRFEHGE